MSRLVVNTSGICVKTSARLRSVSATAPLRPLHTSSVLSGKKNFRKFPIPNKRGQWEHPKLPKPLLENEFDYPVSRDTLLVRWPGYWFRKKFFYVKEMEPELVVPDLDGFELKPYVSYRCPHITQTEFSARDLFNATIADTIIEQFKNNETIDVNVDEEEVERARVRAQQTGADLFAGDKTYCGVQ